MFEMLSSAAVLHDFGATKSEVGSREWEEGFGGAWNLDECKLNDKNNPNLRTAQRKALYYPI